MRNVKSHLKKHDQQANTDKEEHECLGWHLSNFISVRKRWLKEDKIFSQRADQTPKTLEFIQLKRDVKSAKEMKRAIMLQKSSHWILIALRN